MCQYSKDNFVPNLFSSKKEKSILKYLQIIYNRYVEKFVLFGFYMAVKPIIKLLHIYGVWMIKHLFNALVFATKQMNMHGPDWLYVILFNPLCLWSNWLHGISYISLDVAHKILVAATVPLELIGIWVWLGWGTGTINQIIGLVGKP